MRHREPESALSGVETGGETRRERSALLTQVTHCFTDAPSSRGRFTHNVPSTLGNRSKSGNVERRDRVSRRWRQLGTALFALEEFSAGSRTSRVAGTVVQVGAEKRASSPTAIEVPVRVRPPVSEDALVDGARARGAAAWRGRRGRVPIDGKPAAYVCQNREFEAALEIHAGEPTCLSALGQLRGALN